MWQNYQQRTGPKEKYISFGENSDSVSLYPVHYIVFYDCIWMQLLILLLLEGRPSPSQSAPAKHCYCAQNNPTRNLIRKLFPVCVKRANKSIVTRYMWKSWMFKQFCFFFFTKWCPSTRITWKFCHSYYCDSFN